MCKVLLLAGKNNITYASNKLKIVNDDLYSASRFVKYLRHIPLIAFYSLAEWKNHLKDFDKIILVDSITTKEVLNAVITCVKSTNKKIDIILWFRNKVTPRTQKFNFDKLKSKNVSIWSYNIYDCKKYNFLYNNQAINFRYVRSFNKYPNPEFDISFVGANKGRDKFIFELEKEIKSYTKNNYFYITGETSYPYNKCKNGSLISYEEYLKVMAKSKVVLDLVSEENYGLTYRPLEALALKKKLITNNKDINLYDFYVKDNIFILGFDDINNLKDFIETPFIEVETEIEEKFDVYQCMKNFIDNKSVTLPEF